MISIFQVYCGVFFELLYSGFLYDPYVLEKNVHSVITSVFYSCVYWMKLRYCVIQIVSILNNFCLSDMLYIELGALNIFLLKILYIFLDLSSFTLYLLCYLVLRHLLYFPDKLNLLSYAATYHVSVSAFLLSSLFLSDLSKCTSFPYLGVFYPLLSTFCVLIFYVFLWSMYQFLYFLNNMSSLNHYSQFTLILITNNFI